MNQAEQTEWKSLLDEAKLTDRERLLAVAEKLEAVLIPPVSAAHRATVSRIAEILTDAAAGIRGAVKSGAPENDPMAACIAAATELAKLTGEPCHVQVGAWYHPDTTPSVSTEWQAYRCGQIPASYSGWTCEEACDQVRADWAAATRQPHEDELPY